MRNLIIIAASLIALNQTAFAGNRVNVAGNGAIVSVAKGGTGHNLGNKDCKSQGGMGKNESEILEGYAGSSAGIKSEVKENSVTK